VLARNYIEFAQRGIAGVNAAIEGVRARLNRVNVFATRIQTGFVRIKESAERITAPLTRLAAISGAFVGVFARAALKDTVEGERLGKTFDMLARTIGEIFVPYARRLSEILVVVADGFRSLDPETKNSIALFALITAGVTAFAAVLPLVVSGVSAVIGTFVAIGKVLPVLLSAFTSLPGLVLLLAGGFIYLTAEGDTLEKKLISIAKTAQKVFAGTVGILSGMKEFVAGIFATGSVEQATKRADKALEDALKDFDYFGERAGSLPRRLADGMERFRGIANELQERFRQLQQGAAATNNSILGQLGDLFRKPLDFTPPKIKLQVGFESLQGTFDRLQKALAGNDPLQIEKAQLAEQKKINELLQSGLIIRNFPAVVI